MRKIFSHDKLLLLSIAAGTSLLSIVTGFGFWIAGLWGNIPGLRDLGMAGLKVGDAAAVVMTVVIFAVWLWARQGRSRAQSQTASLVRAKYRHFRPLKWEGIPGNVPAEQ